MDFFSKASDSRAFLTDGFHSAHINYYFLPAQTIPPPHNLCVRARVDDGARTFSGNPDGKDERINGAGARNDGRTRVRHFGKRYFARIRCGARGGINDEKRFTPNWPHGRLNVRSSRESLSDVKNALGETLTRRTRSATRRFSGRRRERAPAVRCVAIKKKTKKKYKYAVYRIFSISIFIFYFISIFFFTRFDFK